MKGTDDNSKYLLDKIKYTQHKGQTGALTIISMILGQQSELTKFRVTFVNRTVKIKRLGHE